MKTSIGHVEIAPAANGIILYAHPMEGAQATSDIYVAEILWQYPNTAATKIGEIVLRAFGLEE